MRISYLRVSHIDVNSMFGVLFILAFCFKNKLLQDVVITCDDATSAARGVSTRDHEGEGAKDRPDFQLGRVAVILAALCSGDLYGFKTGAKQRRSGTGTHPQPVTSVVDCVCRFCQGVLIGSDTEFGSAID